MLTRQKFNKIIQLENLRNSKYSLFMTQLVDYVEYGKCPIMFQKWEIL